jgi:phytol kinase
MQQADVIALVVSYVYVFAVILGGEVLGRVVFHGSSSFSRKFVHVGVGMWVLGTVALFKSWQLAVIPPLSFILVNYISYRQDVFKGMESKDKRNLGTVYFPISFSLIIALFWAKPAVVVAGLMPMVWGDALAAVIGERWGKHRYSVFAETKSWEGSAAMLIASFASVLIVLLAAGVAGGQALLASAVISIVATIVEVLTPWGIDNLTVPLLSAVLLWLLI